MHLEFQGEVPGNRNLGTFRIAIKLKTTRPNEITWVRGQSPAIFQCLETSGM